MRILSLSIFSKIGINEQNLKPCVGALLIFTKHEAPTIVMIFVPFTLGEWHGMATKIIECLIINMPSAYYGVLGRPSQVAFRAILSAKH